MDIQQLKQRLLNRSRQFGPALLVALLAGVAGLYTLQASNAATYASSAEAEDGTKAGNYAAGDTNGASGGASVRFGAVALPPVPPPNPPQTLSCDLNATTATFASQLAVATAGQVICLASGNYGNWTGINKAVVLTRQAGANPTISIEIGLNDGNFTLDGLTIGSSSIYGNQNNYASADRPQNITIKNSTFTGPIDISYVANANILLDRNTFNNIDVNASCSSAPARVWISGNGSQPSGVTLSNSVLSGGNSDGVQAGIPAVIVGNEFYNINEKSSNDCAHTDAIQLYGGNHMVIRDNYIHNTADGIVAYDGTNDNLIENNVIDLKTGRFGIELYSDKNSVVRHNTMVYGTGCAFDPCGGIYLDHKSSDPAGSGTVISDNIATTVSFSNGSTSATNNRNMLRSGATGNNISGIPIFAGGASPTTFDGFKLTAGSPGKAGASDGKDIGIN